MAVTYGTPIQVDAMAWRLPVTSDRTPPVTFRLYRDGVLIDVSTSTDAAAEFLVSTPAGVSHFVEVTDILSRPRPAHPGRFTVHWRGTAADRYRIDRYLDAAWVEQATVFDQAAVWTSDWLEDVANHTFRVVAIDDAGNESTPLSFTALMVRRPDSPAVTVAKTAAALTLDIT